MKAGRRGIFIDDGGGHHNLPPDVLVQDFLLYVAVVVENSELGSLESSHAQWLRDAQLDAPAVTELHCAEISFGSKAWQAVPQARRAFHLGQAYMGLAPLIGRIVYGYIGKAQYEALLLQAKSMVPNIHDDYATQKTGLARSFYKGVAEYLSQATQEAVVLSDQGLHEEWAQEITFADSVPVWRKSIFHVRSDLFAGVQLADLVAWTFNRAFRASARLNKGEQISDIDQIVLDEFPKMWAKTTDLWAEPPDVDPAASGGVAQPTQPT
jgi:hypothetical protein